MRDQRRVAKANQKCPGESKHAERKKVWRQALSAYVRTLGILQVPQVNQVCCNKPSLMPHPRFAMVACEAYQ